MFGRAYIEGLFFNSPCFVPNGLGIVHIPEFCRGTHIQLFEHPQKCGQTGEATLQCNIQHWQVRIQQQGFGVVDTLLIQIFIKRGICVLFEQSGKVVFTEAGQVGNLLQRQILRKVFVDLVGDIEELIQIVFLPAVGGICRRMLQGTVKPPDIHEDL